MHKLRLMIIAMFMLTALGGAAVAGFGTSSASAAPVAAHRTCSQSVKPGWRKPSGIALTFSVIINTDTCGRWMRAAERCKYADLGGYSYKWHVDPKAKRDLGQKTSAYCGTLGVKATNWGYQYYVKGSGPGHGWQFRQLGHSTSNVKASLMRRTSWRWSDLRNCLYKVTAVNIGHGGATFHINTDTCHHKMWTVARCGDGTMIYGNVVTNPGHNSTTRGPCGAGNFSLLWWGVRDNQFVSGGTRGHLGTKLHCFSAYPCNNAGGTIRPN